ncbi:MAG: hypothetical protein HRU07_05875, partial [Nitrosopumilus sp.]|nr:hypothetical protein [Nitrosopumilus sp.]NRA05674.1 hypothetical protein [Nitrosopumilus sp.]
MLIIPISVAYAVHLNSECNVSITGQYFPITFEGENRGNPDNSFYPGDGLHFIFLFKASDICNSFNVKPVESEGEIKLLSHNSVMGPSLQFIPNNIHAHDDFNTIPKYLTTFHWYEVIGYSDPYSHNHHCKCAIHIHTDPIFSDSPFFSYREDKELTSSDAKKLESIRKHYDKYQKTETQSWVLAKSGIDHGHAINSHAYEDDKSIELFENFVKDRCSNLVKYQGCVYGHAEIDVKIISELCLHAELKKLGVNLSDIPPNDMCVNHQTKLHLTVQGTKIVCGFNDRGNEVCKPVKITKSKNLTPTVLNADFDLILEKLALRDDDNYAAKNIAGNYYLHDPVTISHEPSLKWKELRANTIQFKTTKKHEMKKEFEFDCNANNCKYAVSLNGLYPTIHDFVNGVGITIYNATSDYEFGYNDFEYASVVKNIDRQIGGGG